MTDPKKEAASASKALERGLDVLEILHDNADGMSLSELARATGRSTAAIYRTVCTLEDRGYVERRGRAKTVRLGLLLLKLGAAVQDRLDIANTAASHMRRLAEDLGDTCVLVVPDRDGVVCVGRVEGSHPIRPDAIKIGQHVAYNPGAVTLVMLAFLPDEERERILGRPFPKMTKASLTDPRKIRALLSEIRETRVYCSVGQLVEGTAGVAAPIFGHDGAVVGVLAVTGIENRYTPDKRPFITADVRRAADQVSKELGFQESS